MVDQGCENMVATVGEAEDFFARQAFWSHLWHWRWRGGCSHGGLLLMVLLHQHLLLMMLQGVIVLFLLLCALRPPRLRLRVGLLALALFRIRLFALSLFPWHHHGILAGAHSIHVLIETHVQTSKMFSHYHACVLCISLLRLTLGSIGEKPAAADAAASIAACVAASVGEPWLLSDSLRLRRTLAFLPCAAAAATGLSVPLALPLPLAAPFFFRLLSCKIRVGQGGE